VVLVEGGQELRPRGHHAQVVVQLLLRPGEKGEKSNFVIFTKICQDPIIVERFYVGMQVKFMNEYSEQLLSQNVQRCL
jgi:hypothetical protein